MARYPKKDNPETYHVDQIVRVYVDPRNPIQGEFLGTAKLVKKLEEATYLKNYILPSEESRGITRSIEVWEAVMTNVSEAGESWHYKVGETYAIDLSIISHRGRTYSGVRTLKQAAGQNTYQTEIIDNFDGPFGPQF